MSKYIYLDSSSYKDNMYIENNPYEFINKVLQPTVLNKDIWEVALTEIDWTPRDTIFHEDLYVMSDIVARSTQVGEGFPEILRILRRPTIFNQPYYMQLSCDMIDSIRIYIRKENNVKLIKPILTSLRCTLHFRAKKF